MIDDDLTNDQAQPKTQRQLRAWPMWIVLVLQAAALIFTVTPSFDNASRFYVMMGGPLIGAALALLWLLFASRLNWTEKLLSLAAAIIPAMLLIPLIDRSRAVAVWIYGVPSTLERI